MAVDRWHEDNRKRWDAAASQWSQRRPVVERWPVVHREPSQILLPLELEILGDVHGRDVCVLGSGDNLVVFALAGLGARVTSVDISLGQLDAARERAETLGLEVQFVCSDASDVPTLADAAFDAVYTGGHVAVWMSNLERFYAEAVRLLRPDGLLVVSEYHPMRRVWAQAPGSLELEHRYFDRGPHSYPYGRDHVGHEFNWTIADYLKAITRAGARLVRFEEDGDRAEDWESAPLAGLPRRLIIAARRDENAVQL